MFAQPFDHSFNDLFNQYVNMDASSADGNKDVSFPGDFDQIFSLDSLSSDCGDQSPTISTSKQIHPSSQWAKDFWGLPQETASSLGQGPLAFQDTVHPSAVSDPSVSLEASSTNRPAETPRSSPATPPETPSRKSKSALVTPKSIRRRQPNDRGLIRKHSSSPSLIRPSQFQKGIMAYPEAWPPRVQNFNFLRSSDDRFPLSPPPSDILVQHENMSTDSCAVHMNHSGEPAEMQHHFDSSIFNQSPAISMPSPSAGALATHQTRYLSHSNNSALTSSSPPSTDEIFPSPHSSDPQSMPSWHSETLGTSGLPFTPDLQSHDAQAWWSPMNGRVPQRQHTSSYQQIVASPPPPPQRPIQHTNHQHDMMQGGLMIRLDPSTYDMAATANSSYPSTAMPPAPNPQENRTYSHVATAHHKYVDTSSFVTPPLQTQPRSPSLSPRANGSPKNGTAIRGITIKAHRHGRKLSATSMSTPKPVKGSTGSGSPKGANKSVTVSFVNFTPNDSQKILTGVAPSGSSKTKARREQEARDRRRKLSEAALNAVRKAGGDVEALEAVLC
ncbi:hypothetical protein BDV29DRAFT_200602 [Aspergillus leporis]|jgi:hypothetical protein|uniref:Developmental regulatory protein wetA n=1 Tax=Aspergillus leporis TaxID=41062 RepID=A0A5N5XER0_9EURO|nr:hypothetical protein BDV29DRAFT_200602 [Aspergillus leporis]